MNGHIIKIGLLNFFVYLNKQIPVLLTANTKKRVHTYEDDFSLAAFNLNIIGFTDRYQVIPDKGDAKTQPPKLWEVAPDGANPHPLLPDWNKPEGECCGVWSADGKYFVFESVRNRVSNIWALREETGLFTGVGLEPAQLTFGPMNFHGPVPAADGSQIFVIGKQQRCELMRYDRNTRQFAPYLSGLSAEGLNFSADGEWITYVTYPEGDLWRSKVDGSQRLQLSFPPLRARCPRWAPDGKRIVFQGLVPGNPWKILLVSSEGGNPQQLMSEDCAEGDPAWAPDGNSLVLMS